MKRIIYILVVLMVAMGVEAQTRRTPNKNTTRPTNTTTRRQSGNTTRRQNGTRQNGTRQNRTKQNPANTKPNPTVTTPSIRGLQSQQRQVRQQIKQQEQALRTNQANVKQRLQDLFVINSAIEDRQRSIDGIQRDIASIDADINILQAQLNTLQQQLNDCKQRYIKSVRYISRHRSVQDKLMFIFSAKNFAQMFRRLRFVRQYASYQRAQGEIVRAKQAQVEEKQRQLQAARGEKNILLAKGQSERAQLQGQQNEQQQMVNSLQKEQKTIQAVLADQKRKDAALNAQIDRLIAEEVARVKARAEAEARRQAAAAAAARKRQEELARQKAEAERIAKENERRIAEAKAREEKARAEAEAARREAERAQKEQAQTAARRAAAERQERAEQAAREAEAARLAAERKARAEEERRAKEVEAARRDAEEAHTLTAADRMMNGGFEANRGRLPMPLTGSYKIVSHYGVNTVDGLKNVTLENKGINILGSAGCQARSVYDGEVSAVFGYSGTWVVMVRHGAYISVYCNLKSASVHVGQKVTARQVLGAVAGDNILQFRLYKEKTKLNPEGWLGR